MKFFPKSADGFLSAMMMAENALLRDFSLLLISHGNTLISLADRYGQGKIQVHERPANGSIAKMQLSAEGISISMYNNQII